MDKRLIKKSLGYVSTILAFLTFIMIFFSAVKVQKTTLSGLDIAFGYRNRARVSLLDFNIIAAVAYVFPLIAGVLALIGTIRNKTAMKYVAVGFVIVGGILILLIPNYWCLFANGQERKASYKKIEEVSIMSGAIVSGIFAIVSGISAVVSNLIKNQQDKLASK